MCKNLPREDVFLVEISLIHLRSSKSYGEEEAFLERVCLKEVDEMCVYVCVCLSSAETRKEEGRKEKIAWVHEILHGCLLGNPIINP